MTDQAAVYRPGPGPRSVEALSRPVDSARLHVVPAPPEPDSELPTSENPEGAPAESITAGQSGSTSGSAVATSDIGFRVRTATAWAATRAYWAPPAVFTQRPASLADLAAYAKRAPWTNQDAGLIRSFGVGYYRAFGYPYTVVSRYREWFVQRPLRYAALLGGLKLASMTSPGGWVVDHLVYPAAQLAGHILL